MLGRLKFAFFFIQLFTRITERHSSFQSAFTKQDERDFILWREILNCCFTLNMLFVFWIGDCAIDQVMDGVFPSPLPRGNNNQFYGIIHFIEVYAGFRKERLKRSCNQSIHAINNIHRSFETNFKRYTFIMRVFILSVVFNCFSFLFFFFDEFFCLR